MTEPGYKPGPLYYFLLALMVIVVGSLSITAATFILTAIQAVWTAYTN